MEIFSQYSRVETAEGIPIELPEFLKKVWEVVGRTALEQVLGAAEAQARNSAAGALEEDARLTALFLWTLQSTATGNKNAKNNQDIIEEELEDEDVEEEGETRVQKTKGYSLIFDVVRRFAQPLGIHLPEWEGRVIETRKGVVRLFSVRERAKQLFGKEGISKAAEHMQKYSGGPIQLALFPDQEGFQAKQGAKVRKPSPLSSSGEFTQRREATTMDRVHAAMLLQSGGQTNALRALLQAEQQRGADFLRLANALSALYPTGTEEKRLLDAMLLAIPRQ